jgi:hypothetical protein
MVRMFRKSVSMVVLLSFVSLLGCSCSREGGTAVSDDERLEAALSKASEVQELISIRDEIAALAIARGVTADQIREAGSDSDAANRLLGLTDAEAHERAARIDALIEALFERYPALADAQGPDDGAAVCGDCTVDRIADSWERYSRVLSARLAGDGTLMAPARGPLKCRMRQVIVGFAICAARSGGSVLFYAICSYGVFCGSCSGGAADIICG